MLVYIDEIKYLVEEFFRSRQCQVYKKTEELWNVVLCEHLKNFFDEKEELSLAFSSELEENNQDSILVTIGAPLISTIKHIIELSGFYGVGYLVPSEGIIEQLFVKIPDGFKFIGCETFLEGTGVEYHAFGRYIFKVTFYGEERREEIIPIFLNLEDGKSIFPVPRAFIDYSLSYKKPREGLIWEYTNIVDLYESALGVLKERIQETLDYLQVDSDNKYEEDRQRLKYYFEYLEKGAKTREDKDTIKGSFKKRISEIKERYRLRVSIKLVNLVKILVPRIFYRVKAKKDEEEFYFDITYDLVNKKFLPITCPHCGKETNRIMICKKHGIECGRDGWYCPVCDMDRCGKCPYVICAIDGRKKDPVCTFVCTFCGKRVGIDHQVKCDVCQRLGCDKCLSKSSYGNTRVCPDCGFVCSVCGKINKIEHRLLCERCSIPVCSVCGLNKCSSCGAYVCSNDSYICSKCSRFFCKGCEGFVDKFTGAVLCPDCVHTCSNCGVHMGSENVHYSSLGNKKLCSDCIRTCLLCKKTFSKEDIKKCDICKIYVCNDHARICPSCGGYVCNIHMFECALCGLHYCKRCRPKSNRNVCSLCDKMEPLKDGTPMEFAKKIPQIKMNPLSNWQYAEGSEVYIFKNIFALTSYVVVVDKKTSRIISEKKSGISQTIKKFFNR